MKLQLAQNFYKPPLTIKKNYTSENKASNLTSNTNRSVKFGIIGTVFWPLLGYGAWYLGKCAYKGKKPSFQEYYESLPMFARRGIDYIKKPREENSTSEKDNDKN